MEIKRILKLAGLSLIAVLIAVFVLTGFIFFDGMSYNATGSEKLNPAGTVVGKTLIVYDPGITGESKNISTVIARNLQAKGYEVTLAGIRSSAVANTLEYNVIIVGGPIYASKASASVQSYLSSLKPSENAKIAVFGTGQDADILNDKNLLQKEVAPLPEDSQLKLIAMTKFISGKDNNKKATEFVDSLLQ